MSKSQQKIYHYLKNHLETGSEHQRILLNLQHERSPLFY